MTILIFKCKMCPLSGILLLTLYVSSWSFREIEQGALEPGHVLWEDGHV